MATSAEEVQEIHGDLSLAFESGNRALNAGQTALAIRHYKEALVLAPGAHEIYNNLATAYQAHGELAPAVEAARSGLQALESFAPLHNTLANCLASSGDTKECEAHYRRALELDPHLTSATVNLAYFLSSTGRSAIARTLLEDTSRQTPGDVEVLVALGMVHLDQNNPRDGERILKAALELSPGHPIAANQLAILLLSSGRNLEALSMFQDLVARYPTRAKLQVHLGLTLQGMARNAEAADVFRLAYRLDPDDHSMMPFYLQSLMHECAWDEAKPIADRVLDYARGQSEDSAEATVTPFMLAGTDAEPELQLKVARGFSKRCLSRLELDRSDSEAVSPRQDRSKLRIGYVSPDFRNHSLGSSFLHLLAAHDSDRFEWYGYLIGGEETDAGTEEFKCRFNNWRDLRRMELRAASQIIREDDLDVVVDLAGHTKQSGLELFAYNPAPLQAHYLGFGCTIGADCIHYLITDKVHTPPDLAEFCNEQLVYLPDSFFATGRPDIPEKPADRQDFDLPADAFVFANFGNHYKLDPVCFDTWLRLLKDIPEGVLWLMDGMPSTTGNLRNHAQNQGVDPARIVFGQRLDRGDHLARLKLADLALDTRLHGGGATTLDALWAGVPVLTTAGHTQSSRIGASLLTAAGLPEMVTTTLDDYRSVACKLATSPETLAGLRKRLLTALDEAPLFDSRRLARHLEWAYTEMTRRHSLDLAPARIEVPALTHD